MSCDHKRRKERLLMETRPGDPKRRDFARGWETRSRDGRLGSFADGKETEPHDERPDSDGRTYQLISQHDGLRRRTVEMTFLESDAEAYSLRFG
jgi:hypothetical protein